MAEEDSLQRVEAADLMETNDVFVQKLAVVDDLPLRVFGQACACFPFHVLHSHQFFCLPVAHESHCTIATRAQLAYLQDPRSVERLVNMMEACGKVC